MIKAIIFDLDGVLIETEQETFKFYQQYLKKYNIILKDDNFKYKAGRKSKDFWRDVLSEKDLKKIYTTEITNLKRELFNKYPEKYIKKIAGTEEMLQSLKEKGFTLAVASQNEKAMIKTVLRFLNIEKYFDLVLSKNDIKSLKPDPEIYLLAMKQLNLTPDQCIVVEDSKDGIAAAKNAKIFCIGIKHDYYPENTLEKADLAANDLKNLASEIIKKAGESQSPL